MLNYKKGRLIALADKELVYLDTEDNKKEYSTDDEYFESSESEDEGETEIKARKVEPLLNIEGRDIAYIAGPSGSGKSTLAANLIKNFLKVYPQKPLYVFSRTDPREDPALRGLPIKPVRIDNNLIEHPIDITRELPAGAIILFDDCETIPDDKIKKAVDKLLADILEVGRRLNLWVVCTSHLILGNDRKKTRTIMNEMHSLTVFPRSGSSQQINYALKQYFGLSKQQIEEITQLPSRWVMVNKSYPMYVTYEHGIYIL
jgi:Cdc6-like AAA superfamily ATPase